MPDFTSVACHQHKHDDGEQAAGAGGEVGYVRLDVFLHGVDEFPYVSALNGVGGAGIHLAGVVISWVVREVAADDEEVVLIEIRLEDFGYAFQFVEMVFLAVTVCCSVRFRKIRAP